MAATQQAVCCLSSLLLCQQHMLLLGCGCFMQSSRQVVVAVLHHGMGRSCTYGRLLLLWLHFGCFGL
jgi:hypothetical protein